MKKGLLKTSAVLTAVLTLLLGVPTALNCFADDETVTPPPAIEAQTDETGDQEQTGVLRLRRCEFTNIVGYRAFYLPKYSATSADGTDITHLVTITDSKESDIDFARGVIILREAGEHVLTYSVVDPATGETLTRSFTVTQQREMFNYYNLTGERKETCSVEEQYCISLNPGQGISRFNIPTSNTYYAEVYFNATEATQFRAGLAHVVRTNFDKGVNSNLWWASMVDVENGMTHSLYKDQDWALSALDGTSAQTALVAGEGFKYAIARYGTTIYAFINDVLVAEYGVAELDGVLTAPGIFTAATKNGDFVSAGGVKVSNIDYFVGAKALSKISELKGSDVEGDIKIDVSEWGDFDTPANN